MAVEIIIIITWLRADFVYNRPGTHSITPVNTINWLRVDIEFMQITILRQTLVLISSNLSDLALKDVQKEIDSVKRDFFLH